MYEILRELPAGSRVLDLGSHKGSFPAGCCQPALVIRLDRERPNTGDLSGCFVQADAARLPFGDASFEAVIANHSLEHMDKLVGVLKEIARVVRRDGSLYIAIPDSSTITDKLYRWVYHGGGHVNAFQSAEELACRVTEVTALPLVAIRVLCSSLWFLERHIFQPRPPRRLWLLGNGDRRFIVVCNYLLRVIDRFFRTRASVYGWALYFGNIREEIDITSWTNVCAGCGAAQSAASLAADGKVLHRFLMFKDYYCPNCGSWNLFSEDNRR